MSPGIYLSSFYRHFSSDNAQVFFQTLPNPLLSIKNVTIFFPSDVEAALKIWPKLRLYADSYNANLFKVIWYDKMQKPQVIKN